MVVERVGGLNKRALRVPKVKKTGSKMVKNGQK